MEQESSESSASGSTSTRSAPDDPQAPLRVRLGLAYSLLNFPSPHRLGQSTGSIKRSKSVRLSSLGERNMESSLSPAGPSTSDAAANMLKILSQEIGLDEPDFYPPAKKSRMSHKTVVTTHDDMPLKEFSLFLPSKLPAAIPDSTTVLRDFVFKTTATYLRLWDLSPMMDCVEIRLPALYEEKFSSNGKFLKDFINVVFREIPDVKAIRDLYVPKVVLGPATRLDDVLSGICGVVKISHLFLPLSSNLGLPEILNYDFESFAVLLHAEELNEITIVSPDHVVREFSARLSDELQLLEGPRTVRVHFRSEDLDAPGPQYISCLGDEEGGGELIEPAQLVRSMNVYNTPRHRREKVPVKFKSKTPKQVSRMGVITQME